MQQRSSTDRRRGAEREAAQPLGGQPRGDDAELEQPERVPSLLSAREFEYGQDRRQGARRADDAGERHASASSGGEKGEPMITDEEPPRGKRGMPNPKSEQIQQGGNPPDENT